MSERPPQQTWEKVVEILEVSVLAIVAMATAFSGYQGTQWGGDRRVCTGLRRRRASKRTPHRRAAVRSS